MNLNARILIVEDERIPAEFLKEFLEESGFEVIGICAKGEDAIDIAKKMKPDLIFMDIMLQDGMSGCEAALRISSLIDAKIIFLTAHSDQEMINYALDAGAINYLIKPYREKQILAALQIALNQDHKTIPKYLKLKCGYSYSFETQKLYLDNSEINIGYKSLRLVRYLCEHSNDTVSNEQLSLYVYGKEKDSSTLRTLIFRLKKNLNCDFVDNHNGVGYKIVLC